MLLERFADHLCGKACFHVLEPFDFFLLEVESVFVTTLLLGHLLAQARLGRNVLRIFELERGRELVALFFGGGNGLGHGELFLRAGQRQVRLQLVALFFHCRYRLGHGELFLRFVGLRLRIELGAQLGNLGFELAFACGELGFRLCTDDVDGAFLLGFDKLDALVEIALELFVAHLLHDRIEIGLLQRYDGCAVRAFDLRHNRAPCTRCLSSDT